MQINLNNLRYLQIAMSFVLITQTVVSFTVFSFLQNLSYLVLALTILGFLLLTFLYAKRSELTHYGLAVAIFFLMLFAFTLINSTDVKSCIYRTIETFSLLIMFNYFRNNLSIVLKSCALCFSLITYLNLIYMVLFPSWMFAADDTAHSFILGGNYNQMGGRLICGIATSILCCKYSKIWLLNTVLLFLSAIVSLALPGSMTSLSCIFVFGVASLVPSKRLQLVGVIGSFLFFLLFQGVVVFSGEGLHNNPTAVYIIQDVLGKDLTFTNRTYLWESALRTISESPLFGHGLVDNDWYLSNMDSAAIGPHNFVLALLIYGGVSLLIVFLCAFSLAVKNAFSALDKTSCLLMLAFSMLCIMMTMEVYPLFFVFYLLTLMYYYPDISTTWKAE